MSVRQALSALLAHKLIPETRIEEAVALSGLRPSESEWLRFADQLLMWLGALAITFSILFFIAFNWSEVGRFAKFGMVEIALCGCVLLYLKFPEYALAGKASLLSASILLGVLLGLYGQTYQTGADPWQLFFNWALLITPWAIVARWPALWLLWLALLNLSAALYFDTFGGFFGFFVPPIFGGELGLIWCVFLLNLSALIIWEAASPHHTWMQTQWPSQLIAAASGIPITWLTLLATTKFEPLPIFTIPVWVAWLASTYIFYRYKRQNLFMLAGFTLSLSVVSIAFIGRVLIEIMEEHAFLPLSLIVIGVGTCAAIWLRNIHIAWSGQGSKQ